MPNEDSIEEIAERIAERFFIGSGANIEMRRERCAVEIVSAMQGRDQRAARIIKEHRESNVCKDNCWTTITNQILGE